MVGALVFALRWRQPGIGLVKGRQRGCAELSRARSRSEPTKEKARRVVARGLDPNRNGGDIVNAPTPRKRKHAGPPSGRIVKASVSVDVALHARWCAAASLSGVDRNAFAVEALKRALEGIIVVDRRKTSDRINTDYRRDQQTATTSDEAEAA
jgi:predicted exporter